MKSMSYDTPLGLDPMDFGEDRKGGILFASGGIPHGLSSW